MKQGQNYMQLDAPGCQVLKDSYLRLSAARTESTRALGILLRIAECSATPLSKQDLAQEIVSILIEETQFENCSILIYSPQEDSLKLMAAKGFMDCFFPEEIKNHRTDLEFQRGEGIAWQVFESRSPLFIEDTEKKPIPYLSGSKVNVGCLVCLPLKGEGVLNLSASKPKKLLPYQKRDLIIIAEVIGHVLKNSELRLRLQASHDHLQQMVEAKTSELLRTNKELHATMEYMNSVIQHAPQGIALTDSIGRFTNVNKAFCKMIKTRPKEIIGEELEMLFENKADLMLLQKEVAQNGVAHLAEVAILRTDGSTFPADVFLHDIAPRNKGHEGVMLIIHDLSNQKLMTERLVHSEKLRALGSMAGGIAHDFNNLLTTILGNVELLAKEPLSDKGKRRLKNIEIAVQDGANTVRRLQTFTGFEKKKKKISNCDVNAVVKSAIELTEPKWRNESQKKGITIKVLTYLDSKLKAAIHESELREVLTNLIFNAVDAMEEKGGTISIRTSDLIDKVHIEVIDTGTGMDKETVKRIFDPFFSTKDVGNSGLGLSISYGLIVGAGGTLTVDSKVNLGTTFHITLPAYREESTDSSKPSKKSIRQDNLKILVVDDEDQIVDLLTTILETSGHEVVGIVEAVKAVDLLKTERFDLLLTDLGMPGVSGMELAKLAKEANSSIKVIMLTGWGADYENQDLRDKGIDAVISKPFRFDELTAVIQDVLGNE